MATLFHYLAFIRISFKKRLTQFFYPKTPQSLLINVLLMGVIIVALMFPLHWLSPDDKAILDLRTGTLLTSLIAMATAYVFAHFGKFRIAILVLTVYGFFIVFISAWLQADLNDGRGLYFFTMMILFLTLFAELRHAVLSLIVSLIAISIFPFITPVPVKEIMFGAFSFTLTMGLIILAMGYYRRQVERLHQEALQDANMRYETLFKALAEGVVLIDRQGTIVSYNDSASRILEREGEDLIGKGAEDPEWRVIFPDGSPMKAEEQPSYITLQTGQPVRDFVLGTFSKSGEMRWISINTQPIFSQKDDKPQSVVASFTDITARKNAQERAFALELERQRVDLLAKFVRDASHEFRTPLSIISSSAYIMARQDNRDAREKRHAMIETQILDISKLLDMLLLLLRVDSKAEFSPVLTDVNWLIRQVIAPLQAEGSPHQARFVLHLDETLNLASIDPLYIREALVQVVDNALRYSPLNTPITLITRQETAKIKVWIHDEGKGLSEKDRENLFVRFYRGDEAHTTRGFGLGLPIAHKVMLIHGGNIRALLQSDFSPLLSAFSIKEGGTCFELTLPLVPPQTPNPSIPVGEGLCPASRKTQE